MKNIHEILLDHCQNAPSSIAIRGDKLINYSELGQLVQRCANFIDYHVKRPNNLIGVSVKDDLLELVITLAMSMSGRGFVSLPPAQPQAARLRLIDAFDIHEVIHDDQSFHALCKTSLHLTWQALDTFDDHFTRRTTSTSDSSFIAVTSSGSTGEPKKFIVSHAMLTQRLQQRVRFFHITDRDCFVRLSSSAYIGSKVRLLSTLYAGGSVIMPAPAPNTIVDLCLTHGATFMSAIVLQVEQLLATDKRRLAELGSRLRVLELSASHVPQDLRQRILNSFTPNIYITYSTNESGAIAIARPQDVLTTPGSVGKPLDNVDVKILDRYGSELPHLKPGMICVRTSQMIDSYLNSKQTSQHFRKGYFVTGDVGQSTPEGDLIYLGRFDDMMIVNGVNIYPAEIESTFKLHPDVLDVKVTALRHKIHQHLPICAVVLKPESSATAAMLLDYGYKQLGNRAPRKVVILDSLPRNDLGKVSHELLLKKLHERTTNV